ncbi:MAG: (2Fe-2S)-binding protein [Polyangiales bacterium]
MLVCHCHAVNDRMIRQCVNDGARSEHEVREACGAGSSCGSCKPAIDRLIELYHDGQSGIDSSGARG